jgi:hypothetical protein
VQGGVQRGPSGGIALEAVEDVLERERVVAQLACRRREVRAGCGGRLAAVVDRRRLATAHRAVVLELHLHDLLLGPRATRDAELLCEGKRGGAGRQLHGREA